MSIKITEITDALGNELRVGNIYGYSYSKNGSITTAVGRLIKIGKKQTTIAVLERRYFLWGEPIGEPSLFDTPITLAHPNACILFPAEIKQNVPEV